MDSNLHHRMWNPVGHNSIHREALDLVSLCSRSGFRLVSPKHIPTYYSTRGKGTVIDLTWANSKASKLIYDVQVSGENFGSDHQALTGKISLKGITPAKRWAKPVWEKMDHVEVCKQFERLAEEVVTTTDVNDGATILTDALQATQSALGRLVKHDETRPKAWWDPDILNPILQISNRAQQWMIRSKTEEAYQCYNESNNHFRHTV